MGTRARINIFDGNQLLVSIYKHWDGGTLGEILASHAKRYTITDGIGSNDPERSANGMPCYAAQLIRDLKARPGDVYIRDTGPESMGEEFIYNICYRDNRIWMTVLEGSVTFFGMPGDSEAEMKTIYNGFADEYRVSADVY
jgi:hypothetical protein